MILPQSRDAVITNSGYELIIRRERFLCGKLPALTHTCKNECHLECSCVSKCVFSVFLCNRLKWGLEMLGTLMYASIHKHSEAEQDRNQAVCALQTEPIVCRWAFNGPTAGHKGLTAPACCFASHWPILQERGQLASIPASRIWYILFFCHKKSFLCITHPFLNNCAHENRCQMIWRKLLQRPVALWNSGLKLVLVVYERYSALLPTRVHSTLTNTSPNRYLELRPVLPPNAKGSAHAKEANTPKRHLAETCTHTNSCTLICSLRCPPFIAFHVSSL